MKNDHIRRPSVPESFHVMLKELQALNIRVDLMEAGDIDMENQLRVDRMEALETYEPGDASEAPADIKKEEPVAEATEEPVEAPAEAEPVAETEAPEPEAEQAEAK